MNKPLITIKQLKYTIKSCKAFINGLHDNQLKKH